MYNVKLSEEQVTTLLDALDWYKQGMRFLPRQSQLEYEKKIDQLQTLLGSYLAEGA